MLHYTRYKHLTAYTSFMKHDTSKHDTHTHSCPFEVILYGDYLTNLLLSKNSITCLQAYSTQFHLKHS